jgi:ketosteroid isomerase-like protein
MSASEAEILALARTAIEAGQASDYETLRSLYAPDAKLWANTSQEWKTLDQHFGTAGSQRSTLQNIRYAEPRISIFEDGYVQQFRFQATTPDGGQVDIAACQVVRIRDGKIVQREEYMDSAPLKALAGKG